MGCIHCLLAVIILVYTWESIAGYPVNIIRDDMIFTEDQYFYLTSGVRPRNMLDNPDRHWPNQTVFYRYGTGLDESDIEKILIAMKNISDQTCIKFRMATTTLEPSVLLQRVDEGCWATVGYKEEESIQLNLGRYCMDIGRIQHELLHILGFLHMQCDPKRDEFIDIIYENISPGNVQNFEIYHNSGDFGVGYDYDSIMHYSTKHFSKNNLTTIVPKQPGAKIGQRAGMSVKDVQKINIAYCGYKID